MTLNTCLNNPIRSADESNTSIYARLGTSVSRHPFTVWNFHPLPPASFHRRTHNKLIKPNFDYWEKFQGIPDRVPDD